MLTIDELHAVIQQGLTETGITDYAVNQHGRFTIRHGSALAFIEVVPYEFGGSQYAVRVWSPLLNEVVATDELCWKLLAMNAVLTWGAVGIKPDASGITDAEGNPLHGVMLSYGLVGDALDPGEVANAVRSICEMADGVDDLLQESFGGLTGMELVEVIADRMGSGSS